MNLSDLLCAGAFNLTVISFNSAFACDFGVFLDEFGVDLGMIFLLEWTLLLTTAVFFRNDWLWVCL